MPIATPEDSQAEICLKKFLFDDRGPRRLTPSECTQANELAMGCGTEAWLGLALDVLNAMGKLMPHPRAGRPLSRMFQVQEKQDGWRWQKQWRQS